MAWPHKTCCVTQREHIQTCEATHVIDTPNKPASSLLSSLQLLQLPPHFHILDSTLVHNFNHHLFITMQPMTMVMLTLAATAAAGPVSYAICQAGCAAIVMPCHAASGAVFGIAVPLTLAIAACNAAFGFCQSQCWLAALLGP